MWIVPAGGQGVFLCLQRLQEGDFAMRRSLFFALTASVAFFSFAATGFGDDEKKPGDPKPNGAVEQSLMGGWKANSILVFKDGEARDYFGRGNELCNVVISNDAFTIRVGNAVLAEMSFTYDPKPSPPTIDLKSKDGEMLGIYEMKGNRLKIGLNDAAKGRPKDFHRLSLGMAFILTRVEGVHLYQCDADGGNARLYFGTPEYTHCRTPVWSPDGTKVAFVAIRSLFGEKRVDSRIIVADSSIGNAGGSLKELATGATPSWSPDGKRIALTGVGETPPGTYVTNSDGSEPPQHVTDAWYGKWSPKNDELACIADGNLCLFDMKTKKQIKLLDADWQEILWGFDWSPDGLWICFKGTTPEGQNKVAIVHREGQKMGFRVLLPSDDAPDIDDFTCHFAWEPTGDKRILASLTTKQNRNFQLFLLDPQGKEPPMRLPEQDPSRSWSNGTWSPDGKRIIYCMYGADLDLGIRE
jgi:uncharacterized protein (TIGR03067 family)